MKTPHKILLIPVIDSKELDKYATNDKEYKMTAIPTITTRFGPSGSLKNININLEKKVEVTNKMSNDIFLDLKYIL